MATVLGCMTLTGLFCLFVSFFSFSFFRFFFFFSHLDQTALWLSRLLLQYYRLLSSYRTSLHRPSQMTFELSQLSH